MDLAAPVRHGRLAGAMISVARSGPPRAWPHGHDRRRSVSCRRGFPPCQLTLRTLDRPVARTVSAYGGNPLRGLTVPADHGATASKRPFKSTQAGVRSARSLEPLGICHLGQRLTSAHHHRRGDRQGGRRCRPTLSHALGGTQLVLSVSADSSSPPLPTYPRVGVLLQGPLMCSNSTPRATCGRHDRNEKT